MALFAVNAGEVATPAVSVATDTALAPPANTAEAPTDGAVNVTGTFAMGVPEPLVTVATSGWA